MYRIMYRMYRGCFSGWASVTSGVPQGSVLGPLLFNLFINDISHNLTTKFLLFADDTLIYQPIQSPEDELALQGDLNELSRWSDTNGMLLNIKKTKVLHMSRAKKRNVPQTYFLKDTPLSVTESYKYLGLTINSTLTWSDHINAVVCKANRTLGFIWQVAGGTSTKALTSLYKSLVLPVLEYGLPAWMPYTAVDISKLERVQ